MKVFILFIVFLILAPLLYYSDFNVVRLTDINVINDSTIHVGENETCVGLGVKAECMEGLKCVYISTYPYENAICMTPQRALLVESTEDNELDLLLE